MHNELPGVGFETEQSESVFKLSRCSLLDIRLAASIVARVKENEPNIDVIIQSYLDDNIAHQLKYQETEFVISYNEFDKP